MEWREGDTVRLDNKHHLDTTLSGKPLVVKTGNGVQIDLDQEPVILFRGRDKLALPMLKYYRTLCVDDGCTEYQLQSMDDMIRRFVEFANSSDTMKQPGITKGA
jgi:hypothetical protein